MSVFNNFINGQWVSSDKVKENINPSNIADIVGKYAQADSEQTELAITSAHQAFSTWASSGIQQRCDVLDAIGNEILARKEELGYLLSREEGKTLSEGIGEVTRAGQIFKYFAGETLRFNGDILPSVRPSIEVQVTREPVGPVGIITPWNFPMAIPAWKIAPSLAYGNTVVFKPASQVPGSACALADIISRSGLPKGVFNLVMGSASIVGDALLNDSRIQAISFTGSVETGHKVASSCHARGIKYQTEMGGKNPLIVLNDADLDTAVSCAINGAYFSTGQRCTASSRIIVEKGIYDQFIDAMLKAMDKLCVGDALDKNSDIGPVINSQQLQQNLDYIQVGQDEGATLLFGGQRISKATEGFYLSPALFVDTTNTMRINQEEIFGPIASVIKVDDYEEAVQIANDTNFGLCAGICTSSLRYANQFKQQSQVGMVMVNLPTAGVDYHVPFGGTKSSSFGAREQGRYANEFYTKVKTSYVNV